MLDENTRTHALSILKRFDINFLENAWELNCRVTLKNKLKWDVLKSTQKATVWWEDFSK